MYRKPENPRNLCNPCQSAIQTINTLRLQTKTRQFKKKDSFLDLQVR